MDVEFLDTESAAKYLGLAKPTLERKRLDGSGPPFAKLSPGPRGPVKYRRADLDAWVASKIIANTSQEAA